MPKRKTTKRVAKKPATRKATKKVARKPTVYVAKKPVKRAPSAKPLELVRVSDSTFITKEAFLKSKKHK